MFFTHSTLQTLSQTCSQTRQFGCSLAHKMHELSNFTQSTLQTLSQACLQTLQFSCSLASTHAYFYAIQITSLVQLFNWSHNSPNQPSAGQSSSEQPRATQSNPEQPGTAQSSPKQPRTAQSSPKQRTYVKLRQKLHYRDQQNQPKTTHLRENLREIATKT